MKKNEVLYNIYVSVRNNNEISFVNDEKLLKIITFWINYFCFACQNMKRLELNLNNWDLSAIKKSILYAENIYNKTSENNLIKKEKKRIKILFYFINLIFPLNTNKGILPGGLSGSILDFINFYVLLQKIRKAKIIIDTKFKKQFLEEANKYLDNYEYNMLLALLPEVFFSRGLSKHYHFPNNLIGSPNSFLDNNYNYIKLLLGNRKVSIIGIQHGGGYGEWDYNPYEKYEQSISEIYYGWGLAKNNILQNRYHNSIKKGDRRDNKIYWIGRDGTLFNGTECFSFDSYTNHLNDVSHIAYFANIFDKYDIIFCPHPRNGNSIYKHIALFNKDEQLKTNKNGKTDNIIRNCKLVIFDCLSHTLMYECIYFEIPFVIFLNEFPVDGLSEKALSFFNLLNNNNIIITMNNERSLFSQLFHVQAYLEGSQKEYFNAEVKYYIDREFKLLKTIKDV